MRKKKKIFSVIAAALAMSVSATVIGYAADTQAQQAADGLNKLGLFQGTDNGYELEKSLTRAEAITMIVRLLGEEVNATKTILNHPFTDVPQWASPYVGYAYFNNITDGVSETEFAPDSVVTLKQFLTFVLRILDYKDKNVDFVWDAPEELAIKAGILSKDSPDTCLRGDMVVICRNALNSVYKGTSVPMYKLLVEKEVFSAAEYKAAFGQDNKNIVSSGSGGGGSSAGTVRPDDVIENSKIFLEASEPVVNASENLFKTDAVLSEDSRKLKVNLTLEGKVNLCGFDLLLKYNPNQLKLIQWDDELDFQIYSAKNEEKGLVSFNYTGIKNITKTKQILTAEFEVVGNSKGSDKISFEAVDVIRLDEENEVVDADYTLTEVNYSIK